MKITLASILAFLLLGSAAIVPAVAMSGEGDDVDHGPVASSCTNTGDSDASSPESCSVLWSEDPSMSTGDSIYPPDGYSIVPDEDASTLPGGDESIMPPSMDEKEAVSATPEKDDAGVQVPITVSDENALLLATNQADSLMGYHQIERNDECALSYRIFLIADFTGDSEDEAYFKLWEAMNAAIVALANEGVKAANCTFENASICIWV